MCLNLPHLHNEYPILFRYGGHYDHLTYRISILSFHVNCLNHCLYWKIIFFNVKQTKHLKHTFCTFCRLLKMDPYAFGLAVAFVMILIGLTCVWGVKLCKYRYFISFGLHILFLQASKSRSKRRRLKRQCQSFRWNS